MKCQQVQLSTSTCASPENHISGQVRGILTDVSPRVAHLSAGVPLDGLLDLPVGASPQRLQQLVAVLQVVLVVVLLHARAASPVAARRDLLAGQRSSWRWRTAEVTTTTSTAHRLAR